MQLNSRTLQGKTTMSDDFELGGAVKRDIFNVITYYVKSGMHIADQASICVFIKHIYFFKWLIVSLDKTLIHRLVSFIALWSWPETVILTFNLFESIEVHYMDKILECFQQKRPRLRM